MALYSVLLGLVSLGAEEHTLRVLVKDSIGMPVPKAHVALLRHRDAKPPKGTPNDDDPPTVDSMGETDEQGAVIFRNMIRSRRYRVEVRARGFLPWNHSDFRPTQRELNVSLTVGFFVIH